MNVNAIASQATTSNDEDVVYRAKVQQAAEKFESFFISQMLRQMRSATKEIAGDDSIYGKNTNSDMLDYADTSVADVMSRQRAFGIADVIVRQLLPTNNKV
jgi:peptidoglycan hydrolase FlgJ